MAEKVIITGGAGFIGSHLAKLLVEEKYDVTVIDDISTGRRENLAALGEKVRLVETSILSDEAGKAFEGASIFFHLAAAISVEDSVKNPLGTHDTNVTGFLRMLEAARVAGVKRVVLGSSAAVYGSSAPVPASEDSAIVPDSPYGLHKAIDEQYALLYQRLFGIEAVVLRFFNVYGPGQRDDSPYVGVITAFLKKLRAHDSPVIHGDGAQVRDFVHVDDVVRALLLAARTPDAKGATINIGTGKGTTVSELAEVLCKEFSVEYNPRFEPARKGDIQKSIADVARATSILGWSPTVGLREGLRTLLV